MDFDDIRAAPAIDYVRRVLEGRDVVDWLAWSDRDAPEASSSVDVFVATAAGDITWLWGLLPTTPDMTAGLAEGRIRSFRHPDGWLMVVDADDPEMLWVDQDRQVLLVGYPDAGFEAVTIRLGTIPSDDEIRRLGAASGAFEVRPGWTTARVSAALELWAEIMLELRIEMAARPPSETESASIASLSSRAASPRPSPPVEAVALGGRLDDVADLMDESGEAYWCQLELGWPGRDGQVAFSGAVQVHCRDREGILTWLARVFPYEQRQEHMNDQAGPLARVECEGFDVLVPVEGPFTLYVPCDQRLWTVSRTFGDYEALGISVPIEEMPNLDEWGRLRRTLAATEWGVVLNTPGWSEGRVSAALGGWVGAALGHGVEFRYDPDDPVSSQGAEVNELAFYDEPAEQMPEPWRCSFRRWNTLPYEVNTRCVERHEYFYFEPDSPDAAVFVCGRHVPPGVKAVPSLGG